MKKTTKVIAIFLSFMFLLSVLPAANVVSAADTTWKQYLKDFLVGEFPSLFEEKTIKKNQKAFDIIDRAYNEFISEPYDDSSYKKHKKFKTVLDTADVSHDIIFLEDEPMNFYRPNKCLFYDLDNDGIPEIVAGYRLYFPGASAIGWNSIYKLYGTSYEYVANFYHTEGLNLDYMGFFVDPQNNIVSVIIDEIQTIKYFKIIDKKLVYSEYINSINKGKTSAEILQTLKLLPEYDCSDVINSIKNGTPLKITKTVTTVPISSKVTVNAKNVAFDEAKYSPVGIQNFNGHTYAVYDIGMTWHEAKAYCESLGGHLATITSQEEQNFIENIVKDGKKNHYWIGAECEDKWGEWKWITGEEWNYNNWDNGEPNNSNNSTENYAHIYRIPNPVRRGSFFGAWNDINKNCVYPKEENYFSLPYTGFICEWDNIKGATTETSTPSSWAKEDIIRARGLGLLPASLDNSYQQNITREEFCNLATPIYEKIRTKFVLSALEFDDTQNPNVMHMASIGVVNGYPNPNGTTSFRPQNELNRQEAAAILCRLIEAILDRELAQADPPFTDVKYDEQNKWAYYYIGKIQASGVMRGDDNNRFDPFGKFTREQSVVTMMRVWDLIQAMTPALTPIAWDNPVVSYRYDQILEQEEHTLTVFEMDFWKYKSYNIAHSGMVVEKWRYKKNIDGTVNVTFTIHNNNATAGEVLVFDENNILVGRKIISAYVQNPTNLKNYFSGVWEQTLDTAKLDWVFNQQRINSKSTDIDINIPRGGYMIIHNDTNLSDSLKLLYTMDQVGKILSFLGNATNTLEQKKSENILNNTTEKDNQTLTEILKEMDSVGTLSYLLSLKNNDIKMDTIATTWSNFAKLSQALMTSENFYSLLDTLSPDMGSRDTYLNLLFGASQKAIKEYLKGTPGNVAINGMFMATGGGNFINAVRDYNNTLESGYIRIDNR